MLSTRFSLKLCKAVVAVFRVLALSCLATSVYAQVSFTPNGNPDIATMLINLSHDLPNLMRLVTAFAYVMGFFFIIKALMELKSYGDSRTMMSREHGIMGPIIYLIAGTLLIYLPATVHMGLNTFWTSPTPYQYVSQGTDTWSELTNAVFTVIQLVGVIALIRGIIQLTNIGHHGQQGGFFKALTFMVAGVLCINMYQFLQAVFNTLGIGQLS